MKLMITNVKKNFLLRFFIIGTLLTFLTFFYFLKTFLLSKNVHW